VSLLVDTSVWSHAFRRDGPSDQPEVHALSHALESGELMVTTGLILQELLQGFSGPKAREAILEHFNTLPFLVPDRTDYIEAADLRNRSPWFDHPHHRRRLRPHRRCDGSFRLASPLVGAWLQSLLGNAPFNGETQLSDPTVYVGPVQIRGRTAEECLDIHQLKS